MSVIGASLSPPETLEDGGRWYFSRKDIEENSPSRRDGIDLKKETYLRKAYCTFLQDLGMKLKVPQVTIASAIIFCHRFYLRQSHAKNDRKTIATACMFLAGKVEETPRPLKDVILVSFEIINKKDPVAIQKIKQKEVYEQQKELMLLAERVVLATLGFDLNLHHPYKPLVEAIKKFKVAQNALAQVAWNFVNDGLRTSLCLQFKTHHIAAGAIFLAAKFLKVKLPVEGETNWWQEFDVLPHQLEEVSNQMLELYEQNRVLPSQTSDVHGSIVVGVTEKGAPKSSTEDQVRHANTTIAGGSSKPGALKSTSTQSGPEHVDTHSCLPKSTHNLSSDNRTLISDTPCNKEHEERRVSGPSPNREDMEDVHNMTGVSDWHDAKDDKQYESAGIKVQEGTPLKDNSHNHSTEAKESVTLHSTPEVIKMFDEDKLKQLREKRKKIRGKIDTMDEFDPIVKELEDGVELAAAESEKSKQEKKQSWSHPSSQPGNDNSHHNKHGADAVGEHGQVETKGQLHKSDTENVEEGEVSAFENSDWGFKSPKSTADRKRRAGSPLEKAGDGKKRHDYPEDRNRPSQNGFSDKDH